MRAIVQRIALRLLPCLLLSWLEWRTLGPAWAVTSAPLYAVALARPLIDLAGELRHGMRVAVWHRLEGRHFVYRGRPVQVLEDDDHGRWVRAADVRAIVGFTASNGALARTYPDGWRTLGRPPEPHFRDTALIAHLRKERAPEALRLRRWVEREIAFPAERRRARGGVVTPPRPDAGAGGSP